MLILQRRRASRDRLRLWPADDRLPSMHSRILGMAATIRQRADAQLAGAEFSRVRGEVEDIMERNNEDCPHCQLSRDPNSDYCPQCGIGYDERTREQLMSENAQLRLLVSIKPSSTSRWDRRICYNTETGKIGPAEPAREAKPRVFCHCIPTDERPCDGGETCGCFPKWRGTPTAGETCIIDLGSDSYEP